MTDVKSPIVLIHPPPPVLEAFQASGLWEISVAEIATGGLTRPPPDPAQWRLAIECGGGMPDGSPQKIKELGLPMFRTDRSYFLLDAKNAFVFEVAPQEHPASLSGYKLEQPASWKAFQMSTTDHPWAQPMADWVGDFERAFIPGRLWPRSDGEEVYRNADGDPTITWEPDTRVLACVGLRQEFAPRALLAFASRVAPRLWPGVRKGIFHSRKAADIDAALVALRASYDQEKSRLEGELEVEDAFWHKYERLLLLSSDSLVALVEELLREVVGLNVENLDRLADEAVEPRTSDLFATSNGQGFVIEVSGSATRSLLESDIDEAERHHYEAARRYPNVVGQSVIIFNGMFGRDDRPKKNAFSGQRVTMARERGITLVDTLELLRAVEKLRLNECTRERFLNALQKPGAFSPP